MPLVLLPPSRIDFPASRARRSARGARAARRTGRPGSRRRPRATPPHAISRPQIARQDIDARRPGPGLAAAAPAQRGRHPGADRRGEQVAGHPEHSRDRSRARRPHRLDAAVGGVHQHDPAGQAGGDRPAQLVERDLGLGPEAHRRGHAACSRRLRSCAQLSGSRARRPPAGCRDRWTATG